MKKQYKKPEINEVNITLCSMLSTSFSINSNSKGEHEEDFVREHRGTWGNLWKEND